MNRKGRVSFNRDLILDYIKDSNENYLFKHFIPTHIESNSFSNELVYFGYSPYFRELNEGEEIPTYKALIESPTEDYVYVKFEEIVL